MAGFNYQAVANQVAANRSSQQNAYLWMQTLSTLGNAVAQYRQQQQKSKLDTIANSLMDTQNAPKAAAVDASTLDPDDPGYNAAGGPVINYTDGASSGAPPTTDQEEAHNVSLGYDDWNTTPTPTNRGGVAGYQLQQSLGGNALNTQLKQALLARRLMDPSAAAANKPVTPYQQLHLAAQQQREARLALQANTPRSGPRAADPVAMYANRLKTTAGVTPAQWGSFQNPRMVNLNGDGTETGDPNGDYFRAELPLGNGQTRTVTIPKAAYNPAHDIYNNYLNSLPAANAGTTTAGSDLPAGGGTAPNPALFGQGGAGAGAAKVRVQHPDGTTGMIPADQLDAALAQGYKQL